MFTELSLTPFLRLSLLCKTHADTKYTWSSKHSVHPDAQGLKGLLWDGVELFEVGCFPFYLPSQAISVFYITFRKNRVWGYWVISTMPVCSHAHNFL